MGIAGAALETTYPNDRICAAAQRIEPGIRMIAASRSTVTEYRWRNRSASVVRRRRHNGPANTRPIRIRQSPYPNGSALASDTPSRNALPAEPTTVSEPNHVAKMENVANVYP